MPEGEGKYFKKDKMAIKKTGTDFRLEVPFSCSTDY